MAQWPTLFVSLCTAQLATDNPTNLMSQLNSVDSAIDATFY